VTATHVQGTAIQRHGRNPFTGIGANTFPTGTHSELIHLRELVRAGSAFRSGVESVACSAAPEHAMRRELRLLLAELDTAQQVAGRVAGLSTAPAGTCTSVPCDVPAALPRQRKYLTPQQLVDRWEGAVVLGTLANWRSRFTPQEPVGPSFQKFGSRVRYPLADVEQYERTHAVGVLQGVHMSAVHGSRALSR
jgi:hypothetical protein